MWRHCRLLCETLTTTLFDFPDTEVTISWIPDSADFPRPPSNGYSTLQSTQQPQSTQLLTKAHPPTIAAIRHKGKLKALEEWEKIWLKDPRRNPAYRALHHPPSGQPPGIHDWHRKLCQTSLLHRLKTAD